MSLRDRRLGFRVPLNIFMTQYVGDRPVRALTTDLSDTGLFVQSVRMPWLARWLRAGKPIGLEFELPGTGETIWARGEITRGDADDVVAGTGLRFAGIPTVHARLIRDYCIESRRETLGGLLAQIRNPAAGLPLPA